MDVPGLSQPERALCSKFPRQRLPSRGVTSLVELHREVAPAGAATTVGHVRRPPERLTRRGLMAAREQRLGLSVVACLLERDDDEQLWDEIMVDRAQLTTDTDIVL